MGNALGFSGRLLQNLKALQKASPDLLRVSQEGCRTDTGWAKVAAARCAGGQEGGCYRTQFCVHNELLAGTAIRRSDRDIAGTKESGRQQDTSAAVWLEVAVWSSLLGVGGHLSG